MRQSEVSVSVKANKLSARRAALSARLETFNAKQAELRDRIDYVTGQLEKVSKELELHSVTDNVKLNQV
jgi:hypothetical protein